MATGPPLAPCCCSCYANSLLQVLLATEPLAAYLASGRHGKGCVKPSAGAWCALCELQQLAQASAAPGAGAISPRGLMRNVQRVGRQLSFGKQEDSHEVRPP